MAHRPQHTLQIMETQTRFDLNAAVAAWRQELAAQSDLTPIVRRELETHLRDTVAELQARGLNNEEAFWLARRRLGRPQQLGEEFALVDPTKVWPERAFWLVLTLLAVNLWSASISFLLLLSTQAVARRTGGFLPLYNVAHLILYSVPILAGAILLAKGRFDFATKRWHSFFGSRLRLAIAATTWILFIAGGRAWSQMAQAHSAPYDIVINLLYMFVWPLMLLGLLMWLAPKRMPPLKNPYNSLSR